MKVKSTLFSLAITALLASTTFAQAPAAGRHPAGNRPEDLTPEEAAQRMIQKHDANGDGALNLSELTEAIAARLSI